MQLFGSFKWFRLLGRNRTFDWNTGTSTRRVSRPSPTATLEWSYTTNDSYFGTLEFDIQNFDVRILVYICHELVVLLNKKTKRDSNLIDRGQTWRINDTTGVKKFPTNRIRTSDLEITASLYSLPLCQLSYSRIFTSPKWKFIKSLIFFSWSIF